MTVDNTIVKLDSEYLLKSNDPYSYVAVIMTSTLLVKLKK